MRAQPQGSHFINGEYVEDERGHPLESVYPATGEVIAQLNAVGAAMQFYTQEKSIYIEAGDVDAPFWAGFLPLEHAPESQNRVCSVR